MEAYHISNTLNPLIQFYSYETTNLSFVEVSMFNSNNIFSLLCGTMEDGYLESIKKQYDK